MIKNVRMKDLLLTELFDFLVPCFKRVCLITEVKKRLSVDEYWRCVLIDLNCNKSELAL